MPVEFFKACLGTEGSRVVEAVEATAFGNGRGVLRGMLVVPRVRGASPHMRAREHRCERGRVYPWVGGAESRGTCACLRSCSRPVSAG